MLEHVPGWLGRMMQGLRAGHAKLVVADPALSLGDAKLDLASPAFGDGGRLPPRFTADGEGVSPPLVWGAVPDATAALALIIEDPDAPAAQPLVHAIVWNLPADAGRLEEGAIVADGAGGVDGRDVGRSSFGREGWLPPDPPTGHGAHDYVFQLFALSDAPALPATPGRAAFVEAIAGRVLAAGVLTGTYSRGEEASAGPVAATATA
ncbi:YbhB/YbcL family Raf kinase inhibitor-like protein [Sphingomonas sp.]|uniref:YbhB/YbcL family Raf kinase inhibitor-like protein n=1 Tax=Sphingomonas sp. TaxID=28214 RepID=UPI003B006BA7